VSFILEKLNHRTVRRGQFYHMQIHATQVLDGVDELALFPEVYRYLQPHNISPEVQALLHILYHDTDVSGVEYHAFPLPE
jgi:hypothetical protein